ncbi:MAG: hypothetical protein ACJ76H_10400 [Bacteriovoracaceae bacterium]
MKYLIFVFVFLSSFAHAGVRELFLPTLNCGQQEFQDVTVTFDDTPDTRKDLTVGKLCEKLALKLLRRPQMEQFTRFIADEMAPKRLDPYMPRANDFFRLVLFKGDIVRKKDFDFTEDKLDEILQRLDNKIRLKVSTFEPNEKQMVTLAFHKGGTAYFNELKLERNECQLINTLVHEYMHFVGYSHGDNSPVGKENSVPYYFGNRAQELCEAGVI